jgi:polyhydroxyalkanoate synthesis regulator phasin
MDMEMDGNERIAIVRRKKQGSKLELVRYSIKQKKKVVNELLTDIKKNRYALDTKTQRSLKILLTDEKFWRFIQSIQIINR